MNGFGPQGAAAGDARLGAREVDHARFQVHGGQRQVAAIGVAEAAFDQGALRVEELVAQFLDRDAYGRLPGFPPGVQGVPLFQVHR
jgi:hypothetical protein